jgi:hypothetical protein
MTRPAGLGFGLRCQNRKWMTEAVYQGESPKGFPGDLVKQPAANLAILMPRFDLNDLRSPPGKARGSEQGS